MWKYQQNEIEKEKNPEGKKLDTQKERYRNDLEEKIEQLHNNEIIVTQL